ncbi:PREDICTED: uncharacterized protein LOC108573929 [Habropoda laboriosa]|uniref:uncharacterized protein LOC108573929 n=1 Tax=Habropoda laboriosa TaxID=597456 RepID=UPI00083D8099|nr:PREDICTED: uncharacterized protein LOC108573929 [Habropoda laboriosa]
MQAHLDGTAQAWKKFDDIQDAIEELDENETDRRFELHNNYYAVTARARKLLDEDLHATTNTRAAFSPTISTSAPITVKLPEMRLPTFDGTIEDWDSFFDIFESTIDRNENLTSVQKLQYLRSALTGRAATCVRSLTTRGSNYEVAIELLKQKFDCTRRILLRHVDAIRDLPRLSRETPEALGELVDTYNLHLRALKNMGEPIEAWNTVLISSILSKISYETAWQWELTLTNKKMPAYNTLLDFLEKRANCASAIKPPFGKRDYKDSRQTSSTAPKTVPPRSYAFITTQTQRSCPNCQGPHDIWACENFLANTASKRLEITRKIRLCTNCLRPGHSAERCNSSSCRVCNGRHHTLLHRKENSRRYSSSPRAIQRTRTSSSSSSTPPPSPTKSSRRSGSPPERSRTDHNSQRKPQRKLRPNKSRPQSPGSESQKSD